MSRRRKTGEIKMNYTLLKRRMDKFFKETSAEKLMQKFKEIGYSFVNIIKEKDEQNKEKNIKQS